MLRLRLTRPERGLAHVHLSGELDGAGVDAVGRLVGALAGELRAVVLDLSALTFVDVAGWRALHGAAGDLAARGVEVRTVDSPATQRLVGLVGPLPVAS